MSKTETLHHSKIDDSLPGWAHDLEPVPGIAPVNGWNLFYLERSHGWLSPTEYCAHNGRQFVLLGVSRWGFVPNQARFEWLVRNNFPSSMRRPGGAFTPVTHGDIDAALAQKVAA